MRILGIDLGLKRTGLAITDPQQTLVSPLKAIVIDKHHLMSLFNAIKFELSPFWNEISDVVIGNSFDDEFPNNSMIVSWQQQLKRIIKAHTSWNIHEQTESFTSVESIEMLKKCNMSKKQIFKYKDAYASCIMISNYMLSVGKEINLSI